VPCHRVVAANGSIGGFMGDTKGKSIQKKMFLLAQEDVNIVDNRVANFENRRFSF
jgi:alkylated DNA nucleotide flippase Atl1